MWRLSVHGRPMSVSVFVCSFVVLLFGMSGGLKIGTAVTAELTIDPAVRAELLRCWTCNQTDNCRDMYDLSGVTTTVCRLDQAFCAVIKHQTVSGDVKYARGCQKDCRPDCHRITESYDRMQCFSCCSNSLCNSETSSASYPRSLSTVQLSIGVFLFKLFNFTYFK